MFYNIFFVSNFELTVVIYVKSGTKTTTRFRSGLGYEPTGT